MGMFEGVCLDVFPRLFQLFTDKESACQMSTVVLQGLVAKHRPVSLTDTSLGYQVGFDALKV